MKSTLVYFLFLGLAVTFWANSLKCFFSPDQIQSVLQSSVIFSSFSQLFPTVILLLGFFNIVMALFLGTRIFPRLSTIVATIWLGAVMIVLFTQGSLMGAFDAFEHAATLALAAYLCVLAFSEKKEQISQNDGGISESAVQEVVPEFKEERAVPNVPPAPYDDIPVPQPPSEELPEPPTPPEEK